MPQFHRMTVDMAPAGERAQSVTAALGDMSGEVLEGGVEEHGGRGLVEEVRALRSLLEDMAMGQERQGGHSTTLIKVVARGDQPSSV